MEKKTYFRGAIIGGYNKEDVHRCIQEMKKEMEEECSTKEQEIGTITQELEEQQVLNEELSNKNEALEIENEKLQSEIAEHEKKRDAIAQYFSASDVYREQAHTNVLEAMKIQSQYEELIMSLAQRSYEMKQFVNELYKSTEKKLDVAQLMNEITDESGLGNGLAIEMDLDSDLD